MRPTLHTLPGTGTPYGLGFYGTLQRCPAKAAKIHALGPDRYCGSSGIKALDVGALFHAYQLIYRKQGYFETSRVRFAAAWEESYVAEATRLFKAYRIEIPPDYWGKVVAAEVAAPNFSWDKKNRIWVVDKVKGARASRAVGAEGLPVTTRPDLVVKITTKDARRIKKFHGITVTPGYWMIDYKTASHIDGRLFQYYELSLQFRLYPLVWNATHPNQQVKGVIADIITKERHPQFHAIKVPLNIQVAKRVTAAYFAHVLPLVQDPNWGERSNPGACTHWRDPKCEFYNSCKHRIV